MRLLWLPFRFQRLIFEFSLRINLFLLLFPIVALQIVKVFFECLRLRDILLSDLLIVFLLLLLLCLSMLVQYPSTCLLWIWSLSLIIRIYCVSSVILFLLFKSLHILIFNPCSLLRYSSLSLSISFLSFMIISLLWNSSLSVNFLSFVSELLHLKEMSLLHHSLSSYVRVSINISFIWELNACLHDWRSSTLKLWLNTSLLTGSATICSLTSSRS